MQNVVNYIVPFFGNDGRPIAAGRVGFCKPDCSAEKINDIPDPDYIVIKDKDDNVLENPVSLNDCGRFSSQPFVGEGVEFKMIVERPTGISAEINDDSPCWETEYIVFSKFQDVSIDVSGIGCASSIAALKNIDPSITSSVFVLGYDSHDDFCPARIFKYIGRKYTDNQGTRISSNVEGFGGTWVCEPSGFVDVRWFGINPSASRQDLFDRISLIAQQYPNVPIYFPAGNYYVDYNLTISSLIMERNSFFYPYSDTDVKIRIYHLDNRGGKFCANNGGSKVIPVVNCDIFCTSWLSGAPFVGFVLPNLTYSGIFDNCKFVALDNYTLAHGSAELVKDIGNAVILNKDTRAIPNWLTSEIIIDMHLKRVTAPVMKLGGFLFSSGRVNFNENTLMEWDDDDALIQFLKKCVMGDVEAEKIKANVSIFSSGNITASESLKGKNVEGDDVVATSGLYSNGTAHFRDEDANDAFMLNGENLEKVSTTSDISLASLFPDVQAGDIVFLKNSQYNESSTHYGQTKVFINVSGYVQVFGTSVLPFMCVSRNDNTPYFMPMFDARIY